MEQFLKQLLNYYGMNELEYNSLKKDPSEVILKDPFSILGMDRTVERIKRAISNKEKIIIYGDYDCDGISATTIMYKTFQLLKYEVSYYIPSRYLDGYGLNTKNVEKIASKGFSLIICVDNGISANEAIELANSKGIDVIVIDHHEVPEKMVNAYIIIHPTVSKVSNIIASGGYMSLFVSAALLNRYDNYLVTIAGLSVISDLMELKDYNRDVVILAINNLRKYRYLPLFLLLDSYVITEKSFSMEIAPKINAIGRIVEDTSVNRLVKYLTIDDEHEIYAIHEWIDKTNDYRKELTKEAAEKIKNIEFEYAICYLSDMKEGLIGLLANRLMNEYNVPSIVFTNDSVDETLLKGSIRSKEGFNVVEAFKKLDKYLINGGGHALAGGLTIKKDDFNDFKNEFIKIAKDNPFKEEKNNTIDISLNDINFKNYEILRTFSPFGVGNKEPIFSIKDLPTKSLKFVSSGKHLLTQLTRNTKLLGFNMEQSVVLSKPTINVEGIFNLGEYKGFQTLEFRINKFN